MFQKRHWRKNPETALRPIELLMHQTATKDLPAPWFSREEKPGVMYTLKLRDHLPTPSTPMAD